MGKYTVKFIRPLGDYSETYGQKYWGQVHDADMDVSFNLMAPVNFEDGDEIEFDEKLIKETKAGKEYMQLRKVHRSNGPTSGAGEASTPSPSPTLNAPRVSIPKAAAASDRYLKDLSDYPLRVFTACFAYMDGQKLAKGGSYLKEYLAFVGQVSAELASMSEKLRSSGSEGLKPAESTPETGYEKAQATAKRFKQEAVAPNEGGEEEFVEEDLSEVFDE